MNKLKVHSTLAFVGLIYGANYGIAKEVMPDYLQPFGFILLRVSSATLLFWVFHSLTVEDKIKDKKDFFQLTLCALFGVTANQLLFFKGLSLTSPINASLIMTTGPVIVLVVSAILLKEKITVKKAFGIVLGISGAVLLLTRGDTSLSNEGFVGDLLILANATSYSLYLVLVKPLMKKYKAITVIKWVFFIGLLFIVPFGWQQLFTTDFSSFPTEIWLAIVYVVVFTTFLAYLLNAWALQYVNSSVVGIYIYLQPVFATIIAISLDQDTLTVSTILYSLLIFGGVYLVSTK